MTGDHLDRMVQDADPYRPAVGRHLDGADQDLLEEIMSVPTSERVAEPSVRRRRLLRSAAGAGVAAAVLAGVFAFSATRADRPEPPVASSSAASVTYSALVLRAAETNPRLLIGQPGWKATTVYGFVERSGTIAFTNGDRSLEMNWYPADQYQSYYKDRLEVSKPEPVKVDGQPGNLFRYSATDFAVMLTPRDDSFVEMRTGGKWTRSTFDRVLADVKHVDVRTWLAAMPPEIVTPARIGAQVTKVLAGIPLPPGFDTAGLADLGTNDAYQFGAAVTSRVGCGWIAELERAKKAGDAAALRRAATALRGSHGWKVLHDMDAAGDWPEVFWEIADKSAAGDPPADYKESIGCGS